MALIVLVVIIIVISISVVLVRAGILHSYDKVLSLIYNHSIQGRHKNKSVMRQGGTPKSKSESHPSNDENLNSVSLTKSAQ